MKRKILTLFSLMLMYTLTVLASNDSCMMNGYSRAAIYAREAQIVKAIRSNNNQMLVSLIHFPLQINLKTGSRSIQSAQDFLRFQRNIIVPQDAKIVINHLARNPQDVICRADGVGLLNGGIWLSPNSLKIMTLNSNAIPNTRITPNKPYGKPIPSITNKKILTQFATLYNKMRHDKVIDGSALFVTRISNHMYQLNSEDNTGTINLYKADINNNGKLNYILSYDHQGSLNTDGIRFIGEIHGNKLIPINFQHTIKHNFHIDMSKWYLFHSVPFLTNKGRTYMNYQSDGMTCTYVWKNKTISLINNDSIDCVNKLNIRN